MYYLDNIPRASSCAVNQYDFNLSIFSFIFFCIAFQILNDMTGNLDAKKACSSAMKLHKKYLKKVLFLPWECYYNSWCCVWNVQLELEKADSWKKKSRKESLESKLCIKPFLSLVFLSILFLYQINIQRAGSNTFFITLLLGVFLFWRKLRKRKTKT